MFIGMELRLTRLNGKCYWRIAPMVTGTPRQRLYVGVAVVILAFVLSVMLLDSARTEQQPEFQQPHIQRGY